MGLLIDGYNLMYAVGILGNKQGPGVLQRARLSLLNLLAASLDPAEVPRTIVVFDAKEAPRNAPHTLNHKGISVRFAAEHAEADELIEELIRADSAPKRLTVVSGDHRVQTAARRRKATAIDSEQWLDALLESRRQRNRDLSHPGESAENRSKTGDVEFWLGEFEPVLDEAQRLIDAMNQDRPLPKTGQRKKSSSKKRR